mmetsp:Transcript_54525/g.119383  ORF Transcript_54525/g.119383 Transcript_54525/m.119383 type:complete len:230 (-) Transcript_54525:945-1634(-)
MCSAGLGQSHVWLKAVFLLRGNVSASFRRPKQTSRFDLNGFGEKLGGDVATLVAAAQHHIIGRTEEFDSHGQGFWHIQVDGHCTILTHAADDSARADLMGHEVNVVPPHGFQPFTLDGWPNVHVALLLVMPALHVCAMNTHGKLLGRRDGCQQLTVHHLLHLVPLVGSNPLNALLEPQGETLLVIVFHFSFHICLSKAIVSEEGQRNQVLQSHRAITTHLKTQALGVVS